jgi:hypothetical protein
MLFRLRVLALLPTSSRAFTRPIPRNCPKVIMPVIWRGIFQRAEIFCLWIITLNGENSVKCNAGAIGTTVATCGFEGFAAQRVHLATTNQFVWNIWSAVATPKAFGGHRFKRSQARGAKAPSPLRSAGALHMVAVTRYTPPQHLHDLKLGFRRFLQQCSGVKI